eukprot:462802-Rhodomonas_salina.1
MDSTIRGCDLPALHSSLSPTGRVNMSPPEILPALPGKNDAVLPEQMCQQCEERSSPDESGVWALSLTL